MTGRTKFDRLLEEVLRQAHALHRRAARPRAVTLGHDHVSVLRDEVSKGPTEDVQLDARGTHAVWIIRGLPVRAVEEPGVVRVVAD
jgi:hypothetical protein